MPIVQTLARSEGASASSVGAEETVFEAAAAFAAPSDMSSLAQACTNYSAAAGTAKRRPGQGIRPLLGCTAVSWR